MPAFLILIQEPDPQTGEKPGAGACVDEEHQLLPDGTLLHVTYWKHARPIRCAAASSLDPALEGWTQIRVKTPFEELESNER